MITIKKAKLTKNGCVEATYIDEDGNEVTVKGQNLAHGDLRDRLKALVPYFAELTEQRESGSYDWEHPDRKENADLMRRIDVTGVTVGGDESCPVAVLSGKRSLLSKKVLNLNTPPTFLEPDDSEWPRTLALSNAIDEFFYEVELYITERKWAVGQMEITFTGDDPFAAPDTTDDTNPVVA